MSLVFQVIAGLLFVFLVLLFARVVVSLITVLARDWRPSGPLVVVLEGVFSLTDPPVRAVRRVIPPLTLGSIRLDLGFMVVFFVTYIAYNFFRALGT
ncbi:MAG: YggT family protein [Kineosporiaceae bacterium]